MDKFTQYLKESGITPAKLSSGGFSIGNQFRLLKDFQTFKKGDCFTSIHMDEECAPIKMGGIGEYPFLNETNNTKICIHAGPRIIDELFEYIPAAPLPPLVEQEEPKAAQAYPIGERIIVERIIVQGDKGERGERGLQGLIGSSGTTGSKGETGDKGDKGDVGDRGERGESGPIGLTGATGETGAKGDRGERGESGPQGSQGIAGEQGPAGLTGDIGPIGPQGIQGEQGERGPQGIQGETGSIGPAGIAGERGPIGEQGPQGIPGEQGPKGDVGETGAKGDRGEQGEVGVASAVYPLKLEDKTLSVEQKFFSELVDKASSSVSAQGGGGGNVDLYIDGEKAIKNLRSLNFTGSNVLVTRQGSRATVNIGTGTGWYGSFYDTTTQTAASITVAYPVLLNTTVETSGLCSIVDGSKIVFHKTGLFNLQFSAQFLNTAVSDVDVALWYRLNGADIVDSAGVTTVPGRQGSTDGSSIVGWNFFNRILAVNDYMQLIWHTENTSVSMAVVPAGTDPIHPLSPSMILTVNEITGIGPQGISVEDATIDTNGHLVLGLSNATSLDAGALPSADFPPQLDGGGF